MRIEEGDCREVLPRLAAEGVRVDSVVTDPPYDLGFMGKAWDATGVAFQAETWRAVAGLMKPGAHLVAFGGTRTYHRMAVAIEDAGLEIRDQLAWVYGSGFPKSLDISKALDKAAGAERELTRPGAVEREGFAGTEMRGGTARGWDSGDSSDRPRYDAPATELARQWQGWGTALKPAWEPVVLARKPLSEKTVAANVAEHGTGALNIDGCRVAATPADVAVQRARTGGAMMADKPISIYEGGWRRAPAGNDLGRWPANLCHDGSEEVLAEFPQTESGIPSGTRRAKGFAVAREHGTELTGFGDSGSAARFFYCAKADAEDRLADSPNAERRREQRKDAHPTVKPVDLMRWLCRLITPPKGLILDPFAGTGTTGQAAVEEGMAAILIEREAKYVRDIQRRFERPIQIGGLL